jgi:hypothetical protein
MGAPFVVATFACVARDVVTQTCGYLAYGPTQEAGMAEKATQPKVTEAINATWWTLSGNDAQAAAETRRRARLAGPDAMAFLHYVVRTDNCSTIVQRVRAAGLVLEAGEFTSGELKPTGLFTDADAANGRAAD